MRKSILLFVLFLITLQAQVSRGFIKEGITLKSEILQKEVRYTIYLPFDYQSSERYYPVVYLLHGYTDDDTGWLQFGEANMIADDAIAKREIPPMILVMPDAGVSWYINDFEGKVKYEDFFIKEFIPYIESTYRIRAKKQYRAVSGLSMGGFGSLTYAIKYPEMFSSCAAFSAAVYTKEQIVNHSQNRWNHIEAVMYGKNLEGEERLTKHLLNNNIQEIIRTKYDDKMKSVRYYIDCGDGDVLIHGNWELNKLMLEKEFNHEFRVRDGVHNWDYWRTGLKDGLKFIGKSFHQ